MNLIKKNKEETGNYLRTQMQKERILEKLKDQGCRITKQRMMLLDIILEEECSCCKEIYYEALRSDSSIGIATVYRMVKTLEEVGAIDRRNMYRIAYGKKCSKEEACIVTLDEGNDSIRLNGREWAKVVEAGLKVTGYLKNQRIDNIIPSLTVGKKEKRYNLSKYGRCSVFCLRFIV